jgi:hypothetical protein
LSSSLISDILQTEKEVREMLKRVVILIIGPLIGFAYVLLLPFIVPAMVIGLIASKPLGRVGETVQRAASFSWRPTESYLSGKKGRPEKGG